MRSACCLNSKKKRPKKKRRDSKTQKQLNVTESEIKDAISRIFERRDINESVGSVSNIKSDASHFLGGCSSSIFTEGKGNELVEQKKENEYTEEINENLMTEEQSNMDNGMPINDNTFKEACHVKIGLRGCLMTASFFAAVVFVSGVFTVYLN